MLLVPPPLFVLINTFFYFLLVATFCRPIGCPLSIAFDPPPLFVFGSDLGDAGRALSLVQRLNVQPTLLMLDGNPWIMPPEAVVEKGLSAVEMYLSDVLTAEGEVKTMKLLKVVLVGSSQAGKTRYLGFFKQTIPTFLWAPHSGFVWALPTSRERVGWCDVRTAVLVGPDFELAAPLVS